MFENKSYINQDPYLVLYYTTEEKNMKVSGIKGVQIVSGHK